LKFAGRFGALCLGSALVPAPPADAAEAVSLAEIVVSARKVEERLLDVPMSVTVLGTQALAEARLSHLFDLQFDVPGLVVNNIGLFGAGMSLRGVADQAGTGTAVATQVNGVSLGSAQLAIARLLDLDRIEVVKGPQGTLYGRNATGGSINIYTRPPASSAGAGVEASYGSFSTARVQGHADLPAAHATFGLAFIASDGDGYIRNSEDDRRFAEADYWALRASAGMRLGDAGRLDFMAQHGEDDGATGELWTPNPLFLANPRDIRLATVTLEDPFLDLENDLVTANLEYDFGRATLVSVTGYARDSVRNRDDCAGTDNLQGCIRGERDGRYSQWSQELRLHWSGPGPVDGLAGAYYFSSDRDSAFYLFRPGPGYVTDSQLTFGQESSALFGQVSLDLGERWKLTGGLRLGRDQARATTVGTGITDSPTPLAFRQDASEDAWRLDVLYAASGRTRWFASVSTGYGSGGFAQTLRGDLLDEFAPEHLLAVETGIKSRSRGGRISLDAAAFHYDYADMQVVDMQEIGGLPIFGVDNAAKGEIYGIDASTVIRLNERLAISGGAVWLPKREFVDYVATLGNDQVDYSGNRLVRAPEWSATFAIDGSIPLPGIGSLAARLEYDYRSSYYFSVDNDPAAFQGSFGLVNARVQLESQDGAWHVFALGRNLRDEDYFNQVLLQSSPGLPATWEIGAGLRF